MTDKNGKPLKVGDKVTHQHSLSGQPGVVTAIGKSVVLAHFIDATSEEACNPKYLTLVEPKPNPVFAQMSPAMRQVMEYEAAQWEENSHTSPFDRGCSEPDSERAMRAAYQTLGGIPVVTSEAVPKGEAYIWNPAKMKEFLGTEKGREILDKVKAPNPVVNALIGKVESQTFKFPLSEPDYKGMLDEANEKLRKLTRAATQYLTCERGSLEQASAYARLRDAVKEAL